MNINLALTPLISLIAGILILVVPRLLNYIVAIYLIVIGLVGLFGAGSTVGRVVSWSLRTSGSPTACGETPEGVRCACSGKAFRT